VYLADSLFFFNGEKYKIDIVNKKLLTNSSYHQIDNVNSKVCTY